ncbi:SRPBCC family protein [Nocardioides sp. GY 10113]|uniref:SRPBCC family protein n=1 Tax=Nocardioides sp. GY 10113 TaxID=2569761 RepID=UPI00197F69BF|nr:SRPBCC family protein [Nocardioides sp. GY 10113]
MTITRGTRIEADPSVPTVRIVREFDAPRELVYRAHVDPDLIARWLGPRDTEMRIETWEMRTGGEYRYTAVRGGEEIAHFYGSVHRVTENERVVQTFGFDEMPDAVSLDTLALSDLPGGRTRLEILSVVYDFESRASMLASGMETGINDGYEKLDALLALLGSDAS